MKSGKHSSSNIEYKGKKNFDNKSTKSALNNFFTSIHQLPNNVEFSFKQDSKIKFITLKIISLTALKY